MNRSMHRGFTREAAARDPGGPERAGWPGYPGRQISKDPPGLPAL